ncbi:uncharacterized protein LACBIDRAFT_191801 [Laccaria bicolor S238N-H82]|uniref:Predicted protein n=1 Tax=Laccaria bicolor (strain S238N-H82 / ATCC MYA-4686) TaxID=486041 RepID=B0DT88_LACBS|nr:uncharacterized protein LACBIDRAFT_191801 [Laccaria bicolor S238N-H82]EDR02234.1 predicted protein [Laccaria bicolor S238N-H82]|eukprot:XP_001887179.1 predicted protein [Laccaria bicolor S238N-H82]
MRSEKVLLAAIRLNSQDILNQAIALGAVAIKCLLRDDPNRGVVVSCFARALKCRWNVTKEDQHLDDAIYYYRKAVEVEPIDDKSRALHLDDLGCALWQRFSKTHTRADFEEGRSVLEKAISLPDVAKPAYLSHLGRLLKDQAVRLEEGKNAALDVSLEIHLQAISSITKDFRGPPQFLHQNLAQAYFERYAVSESPRSTDSLKEFVMEKVNGSGHRWMFLYELAVLHRPVFISTGHQSEADKMVDLLHSALVDSPGNVNIMIALADILEQKGISLASQSILTEALHFAEESIKATSEYDQNMPLRLRSAATILAHRFDLGSDLQDIERAVSLGEQGLQSSCLRKTDRWKVLAVLAPHLLCRFNSTESLADLQRAHSLLQEALMTPDLPDDAKSDCLREHGKLLFNKYKLDKNPDNIEGSIQSLSNSIALADSQSISVASAYNDLGNAYSLKFEMNGKSDDSRKSIEAFLKAIACVDRYPIISVQRPMYLHNLANSFFVHHERGNEVLDLDHAISYYQEALDATADLSPQASNRTGALMNLDAFEAISSLTLAVGLMSEAIMMGSNRADQLRAAKRMAWLPGHIIAFGLAAGNTPGDIVQLFERGRSFIWNRLVDQKTEISDLWEAHQDLANTFEALREQLTRTRAQSQHDVAVEYNSILKLIRQQEGFENFLLLPARVSRLQDYASFGPIVVLNVTSYRSDAIIIKSEGVIHVPLPLFTMRDYLWKGIELQNALNDEDVEAGSTLFHSVLTWLWEVAAHPVLEELEFVGSCQPGESLPRVWWVANERIASLPIHAAGDHKRALKTGASCSVIDRAVSSYIPTLRFLALSRERAAFLHSEQHNEAPGTALLVQMPTTPNDKDLVNVSIEVEAVESILSSGLQITNMDRPKRSSLLPSLSSCTMAHFACHGVAHPEDPSLSQIKLQDWLYSPFDVRFLLKTPMPKCQFVYLSACETALNRVTGLREEAIHLSSAFQMAGVPYSVGTSWKIDDSFSVDIAEEFYSNLVQRCDGKLDFSRSSYALHDVVMKARGRGVDAMLWAAYIHSGA